MSKDHLYREIQELEDQVSDITDELCQCKGDLEDALQQAAEYESQLYASQQEHAALEKDYDLALNRLDDASHDYVSMKGVAERAGQRWRDHLKYLEEFWPEVMTDLLLRGDIK